MDKIKRDLLSFLSPFVSIPEDQLKLLIQEPKQRSHGLLCFCVFSFLKKNPKFGVHLVEKLNQSTPSFITKIELRSGFINFDFSHSYIQKVFNDTFSDTSSLFSKKNNHQTMVIDYSSPNVAKYMNVGHLRATVIGQALANMAKILGYKVIALNHLGDWGTQFGKLIVAYNKWGDSSSISLSQLVKLYVQFHEKEDESLKKEARETFKKMEEGDKNLLELWKKFVDVSIENYKKIWSQLKVHHDLMIGESFYKDKTQAIEQLLKDKNVLKKSEGALVVFLDSFPPCLIQKKDGASTYACRDLASIQYRFEQLKASLNIYVTGADHHLHFQQLKAVLDKVQPHWAKNTKHLSFGMYRFAGKGKLSSRKGKTIPLEDLIKQAVEKISNVIQEKNPHLEQREEVSRSIAIGALIFNDLKNDRVKDVDFSWNHILNFEGDSGPYIQYCHVRCVSLLKKAKIKEENWEVFQMAYEKQINSLELDLVECLLRFKNKVEQSFYQFKPHILATYLLELCHIFHQFYTHCKMIDSDRMKYRIYLTQVTKWVLRQGLYGLNIDAPKAM